MRRDDNRPSFIRQPPQRSRQVAAPGGIERGGRLVHQQHPGLDRERARDGDALRLAPRKLVRHRGRPVSDAERDQQLPRALFGLGARTPEDVHRRQPHVLVRGHVREQVMELEDHADGTRYRHAAGDNRIESRDCAEDRALPGARRTHQRDDFAGRRGKRDAGHDWPSTAANIERLHVENAHACRHPRSMRRATRASGSDIAR